MNSTPKKSENFISEIPSGLCYTFTEENGKKVSSLNMTRTAIDAVPFGLKGVDRIIVREGQLNYIDPHYNGEIIVTSRDITSSVVQTIKEPMSKSEIKILKDSYRRARRYSADYFDVSSKDAEGREQHLPAHLIFDKKARKLDARKTVLTARPYIFGIALTDVAMPDLFLAANLQKLRNQQSELKRRAAWKNPGTVRTACGWKRKSRC